ncbi:MAG: type II secretion system F family protein [Burkholderiaceae bacterium]
MPDFAWKAARADGQLSEGRIEAPTQAQALRLLRGQGLTPIRVTEGGAAGVPPLATQPTAAGAQPVPKPVPFWKRTAGQGGAANGADVLLLTTELSIMLKAGLALDTALRVLIGMSHKPAVASITQTVLDDVKGGVPLSKALTRHRDLFGDFYINMVRSGEASGQLSAVFERLVEHMERLRALRESVVSATIYPAILLGVAVLSLVAMLGFVVPQFETLFKDMGDALPAPTLFVMHLGQTFTEYGWAMAIGAVVAWLWARQWLRSPSGKIWWQNTALRLPVLGSLLHKYDLTLFARSLGTLLGNGVPLLGALHIATETVGNGKLRQALATVAPKVKDGGKLVDALSGTGIFEPLAINLVRVGEETGRTGPMLLELAHIFNRDVETGIKRALTMLEPLLILVLGLLIAAIIVSILLGILSVNDLAS